MIACAMFAAGRWQEAVGSRSLDSIPEHPKLRSGTKAQSHQHDSQPCTGPLKVGVRGAPFQEWGFTEPNTPDRTLGFHSSLLRLGEYETRYPVEGSGCLHQLLL